MSVHDRGSTVFMSFSIFLYRRWLFLFVSKISSNIWLDSFPHGADALFSIGEKAAAKHGCPA